MVRPKGIPSHRKGVKFEQEYGIEKANNLKLYLSKQRSGIPSNRKGLTLEQQYGVERAKEIHKKSSISHKGHISNRKGKTNIEYYGVEKSNQISLRLSLKQKGRKNKNKGKTFEEIYGIEKAEQLKLKNSLTHRGKNSSKKNKTLEELYGIEKANEIKLKSHNSHLGKNSDKKNHTLEEQYGIEKANEIKSKIRNTLSGRKYTEKAKQSHNLYAKSEKCKQIGRNWAMQTKKKCKKEPTQIEIKLFNLCKQVFGIETLLRSYINFYEIDILIPSKKLCIEADGDFYHANPLFYKNKILKEIQIKNLKNDKQKQKYLEYNGYNIIRYYENDINNNIFEIHNQLIKLNNNNKIQQESELI